MKVLLGLFLCLGLTGIASAQKNPCELTMKDVPTVRGLRLRMPDAELAEIFPVYNDGLLLRKAQLSNISGFENVEKLIILSGKSRIAQIIIIQFDKDFIKRNDARDFTQNLPENIKLHRDCWTYSTTDKAQASFHSDLFTVDINSDRNLLIFAFNYLGFDDIAE